MEAKNLTFPGGLILGAGLMYLFDPERARGTIAPASWATGLQCVAGALGVAAVAYGATWLAKRGREEEESSTSTAFDIDVPKYAWLR
jgi:hypothetical protein